MTNLPGLRLRHARAWRIIRSVLAGLLVMGLLVAGTTVAERMNREPLPSEFRIERPFVGDRGVYDLTVVRHRIWSDEVAVDQAEALRFEFVAPLSHWSSNGSWTTSLAFDYRAMTFSIVDGVPAGFLGEFPDSYQLEHQYHLADPADGVYRGTFKQFTYDKTRLHQNGATSIRDVRWLNETFTTSPGESFHRALTRRDICGLLNPFQGNTRSTAEPVRLGNDCDIAARTLTSTEFLATEALRMRGETCLEFTALAADRDEEYRITFCPSVPYPVQLEVHHRAHSATTRYSLASFERGHEAPTITPVESSPSPAIELRPIKPWGPDDQDAQVPFPAREAFAAAYNASARLRSIIDGPTPWFLGTASGGHDTAWGKDRWAWTFRYYQEDASFSITVTKDAPASPGFTFEEDEEGDPSNRVDPSSFPEMVPSVASTLELWRHIHPTSPAPTFWRYHVRLPWDGPCTGVQEMCEASSTLEFGHRGEVRRANSDEPHTVDGNATLREHTILLAADGRLLEVEEQRIESTYTLDPLVPRNTEAPPDDGMPAMHFVESPDVDYPRTPLLVSAIGIGVGFLVWLWPSLQKGVLLGLFSRIHRPRALEHPTRAQVMAAIESEPGIHIGELAQRIQVPRSTLEHHLRKLLQVRLIRQSIGNGFACYFPSAGHSADVVALAPYLKSEGIVSLLRLVDQRPSIAAGEAAQTLGIDPGTLTYHSKRLQRAKAIEVEADGRNRRLRLTESGRAGLAFVTAPG